MAEYLDGIINKDNAVVYNSECVRKKTNWSKSSAVYKFDSDTFDPEVLLNDISERSPKLDALLKHINELDAADMKRDNQMYKHFIFCDVKSGSQGARMLASAFIASGYNLGYDATLKKKMVDDVSVDDVAKNISEKVREDTPRPGELPNETMASLSPMMERIVEGEESPATMEEETPDTKTRDDTPIPSELPNENIAPFSPVLEGIEEGATPETTSTPEPSVTPDTSATSYTTATPETTSTLDTISSPETIVTPETSATSYTTASSDDSVEEEKMTGGAKPTKKRFNKIELYDTSTLKQTQYNNFYLLSSVDVYDQPIHVKLKKQMLANFNSRPSNVHGKEVRFIIMDGGFKEGIDLFDIKYIHIFEPSVNSSDQKQVIGRGTRTCGQKGLVFHPTQGWPLHVYVYDLSIPEQLRSNFLDSATTFDLYLKSMNLDIRLARFASDLEETSIYGAVDYELNRDVHTFKINGVLEGGAPKKRKLVVDDKPAIIIDSSRSSVDIRLPSGQIVNGMEAKPMDFKDMRQYIQRFFEDCKWTDVKMENMCEDVKSDKTSQMVYTPTQRFVKKYFTPQSPVRGMLLWHSTGTGKTCSAIASATSTFDPQGYTILWVTRTTLKNDIWKNMFDQICNEQIRTMIADGAVLPEDHAKRMRMLSKAWRIRPISYKQFSNLVSKENNYYKQLVNINGSVDPLRKTLLVIDEAHKLYGGGDLSSLERPDMKALHKALMNSYAVSGRDSVRLLLMTATPITENPMELVKLVNLCKPIDEQIQDEFITFSDVYLNEEGGFTSEGRRKYLDNIAGHISYLNREKDARQFAQPHIKRILVPIVKDVKEVLSMDKRYLRSLLTKDVQDLKQNIEAENAKIDADLKDLDSTRFYALRDICDEYDGIVKKGCVKIATAKIRELVNEAKAQTKHIKDTVKAIRGEIRNKNLYRKEALGEMTERLNENPEQLAKFKNSMYYTLKSQCGKTISNNSEFDNLSKQHPDIARLILEIDAYDKRELDLDNQLKVFAAAHKKRIFEMQKMLRTQELRDIERLVVKSTIKDEQKKYRKTYKDMHSQISKEKKQLRSSRKKTSKKMRKTVRKLKTKVKEYAVGYKNETKEQKRAEKQLRKTMRKQGDLREEFKEGILKDLMTKYAAEVKSDVADKMDELVQKEAIKETERAQKVADKEDKRNQKAAERAMNQLKKIDDKAEKTRRRNDEREEKKMMRAKEKGEKKALRLTKKIRISKKLGKVAD
jgi:hypothetical protein